MAGSKRTRNAADLGDCPTEMITTLSRAEPGDMRESDEREPDALAAMRTPRRRLADRPACYYYVVGVIQATCKGQVTIPAHLRAKYGLHAGDEVEVVEADGALQIVRTEGAESRGERLVRRLRNTATGRDVAGMSTDQIMALLRGD
jgi:AbrB family looped-hinge helix DNA binding protein